MVKQHLLTLRIYKTWQKNISAIFADKMGETTDATST